MNLKLSAWAAIVNAIIIIPSFVLGFITGFLTAAGKEVPLAVYTLLLFFGVLSIITGIFILLGFVFLAKKTKNDFLKIISYIALVLLVIFGIYELIVLKSPTNYISIAAIIILGIVNIFAGIAVLRLKKVFGGIAKSLGVLYIIDGAFAITIILTILLPLTSFAVSILEAILFFRASKKF